MRWSSVLLLLLGVIVSAPACFNSLCWDPDPDCKRYGGHFDDSCHCVGENFSSYPSGYPYPTGSYATETADAHVADAYDASASDASTWDASESESDASVADAAAE